MHWRAHAGSDLLRSMSVMLYAHPSSDTAVIATITATNTNFVIRRLPEFDFNNVHVDASIRERLSDIGIYGY